MLSVKECKKYLNEDGFTENQIEEIRNNLYQIGEILVEGYLKQRGVKDGNNSTN